MMNKIEKILPYVLKPGRYVGGEKNSVIKDLKNIKVRVCLVFPDVYEIGMSNLGLQILYSTINENPSFYAERAFAPWSDFAGKLRENNLPLYSLETKTPLREFDIIAISLQYERLYTNSLSILDLGQIELLREKRGNGDPIVIAGGPSTVNPEPMSDFIDLFHIGEGDESINQIVGKYLESKNDERSKKIQNISTLECIYNPNDHDFIFNTDGTIKEIISKNEKITSKSIFYDFGALKTNYPFIIPILTPSQDKGTLQVSRGCTQGCRFCQAGIIDRPVREKSIELLKTEATELVNRTGVRELSFNSLSISDYGKLPDLISEIKKLQNRGINIGLPSLKVSSYNINIAKSINSLRKTGLTFAVEAGSHDSWNIINKKVEKEKLFESIKAALDAGWKKIKLYFMIGLPFSENEAEDILSLANELTEIGKHYRLRKFINLSINAFVPKPFTPFQWKGMEDYESLINKLKFLKDNIDGRFINLKWNNINLSILEGALSRGDRRLGKVIFKAYKNGAVFDGWDEMFNLRAWDKAFESENLSKKWYAERQIKPDSMLPWDKINIYVSKDYLLKEYNLSIKKETTSDCLKDKCHACGSFPKPCPPISVQDKKIDENEKKPKPFTLNTGQSFKVNIFYEKTSSLRFISQLDILNLWEKTIRMADVPINYSQGFNPHPKITFSAPTPIGVTSFCEWIRVDLNTHLSPHKLLEMLSPHLPLNMKIKEINYANSPTKTFNKVEYELSQIPDEITFKESQNLDFKLEIKEEFDKTSLTLPYPEPIGIYKILSKLSNLEKEDLLDITIVKRSLFS